MSDVVEFFRKMFDASDWPPRWHCGNWTQFHGWLYIISDLLIWSAYFAIPLTILRYVARQSNVKFVRAYFLFAAFILACGSTHLLDAVMFWYPAYRLNALLRFITGVVSWVTVFYLVQTMPSVKALRSHEELEKEIAERKKIEEELKVANDLLNASQEIAKLGHWQWDVPSDKITWSNELYKIYDESKEGEISYERYVQKLHPEDRDFVNNTIQKAFVEKVFPSFTHRISNGDGTEKIVQAKGEVITDAEGNVIKMIGTAQDITELQKSRQQLEERTHALETSNAELQRFAYVASHDLQEPLRKIMTFASLLDKELPDGLTEKGKMYMGKIVESSARMQRLIDDILTFSSLRVNHGDFRPTDLNAVLKQVLSDMEVRIAGTGATVQVSTLPTLDAIPSQMGQVFQNLISNAIKFRKEETPPVITINSQLIDAADVQSLQGINERAWTLGNSADNWSRERLARIDISDNGIGFDENYAEKIFEIFQRLHNNKTFEGTGIGLAICKKIVDNHHGVISATGKAGTGATFTIILPLSQKHFRTSVV